MPKQVWLKVAAITALTTIFFTTTPAPGSPFAITQHANWAHLAVNCWALWNMWPRSWKNALAASAIGMAGIYASQNAVGISAALFALIGLEWHRYNCKINYYTIAISLAISALLPMVSFTAHALPLAVGLAIWKTNRIYHGRK